MTQPTKRQIVAAMKAAGIVGDVAGSGANWEVELANDRVMRAFCHKVAKVGGYKAGHGGWVLRPGYTGNGDWNDRASRHHY